MSGVYGELTFFRLTEAIGRLICYILSWGLVTRSTTSLIDGYKLDINLTYPAHWG